MRCAVAKPDRGDDIVGLLVVDKPVGPTSMDVCRAVRRAAGGRGVKVGHAGTLDPLASGALIVAVGRATKSISLLMALDKTYETAIDLAAFSTTDDMEGPASAVEVASPPTRATIEAALARFVGEIEQRPPAHSAVKINGERAYRLARRGLAPKPEARRVVVHEIELLEYAWPTARLRIRTGKGVYIRALARDLGQALGTGGRLASLRRTRVGPFGVERAIALDALPAPLAQMDLLPAPHAVPSP